MQRQSIEAIFWIFIGFAICLKSSYLKVGTLSRPGPGFMPFVAGGTVGVLGLVLLFSSFLTKKAERKQALPGRLKLQPLMMILLILIAYSVFLTWLGYMISTFLFMLSLLSFGAKKGRWWVMTGIALLATLISYLIFNVWLRCNFPEGILKGIFRI